MPLDQKPINKELCFAGSVSKHASDTGEDIILVIRFCLRVSGSPNQFMLRRSIFSPAVAAAAGPLLRSGSKVLASIATMLACALPALHFGRRRNND
jgi:hypothetical protein